VDRDTEHALDREPSDVVELTVLDHDAADLPLNGDDRHLKDDLYAHDLWVV
jgi:hypothetical protein